MIFSGKAYPSCPLQHIDEYKREVATPLIKAHIALYTMQLILTPIILFVHTYQKHARTQLGATTYLKYFNWALMNRKMSTTFVCSFFSSSLK